MGFRETVLVFTRQATRLSGVSAFLFPVESGRIETAFQLCRTCVYIEMFAWNNQIMSYGQWMMQLGGEERDKVVCVGWMSLFVCRFFVFKVVTIRKSDGRRGE